MNKRDSLYLAVREKINVNKRGLVSWFVSYRYLPQEYARQSA